MQARVLKTGDLAYFDCFAGLIPCKVLAITGSHGAASTGFASSSQTVRFKLTARRGAYRRGEVLESFGLHVVPRGAVRRLQSGERIRPYMVEVEL